MTKRVTASLVFFLALSFYLGFNAYIPITDPVESNYALTAKEMLLSDDWISPRIYGHYWFDKPIMIYWLIALSFKIFGITDFAARLPAAIFSAGSVTFIYWFGQKLFNDRRAALLSALVLGTSLEFWVMSKMIITDAVLFFFTSVSLATLYLGMQRSGVVWYIIAYGAAGMAVLTKGPVGLILPGIIVVSYILLTRQWQLIKRLFLLPGIFVFLLVAGPWYFKMYQLHGSFFVDTFLGLHNYVRATISEHPDDNVFYYYLVLFPISLLPWTGILLTYKRTLAHEITSTPLVYLAIWPIIIIVFYTLMATKYLTYVFPATFPVALLIGYTLNKMQGRGERKTWWYLTIPTILLVSIISMGATFFPISVNWTFVYLAGLLSSILLLWLQLKGNVNHLPLAVGGVTVIMSLLLIFNGLIPLAATRSGKAVASLLPASGATVASYGDYSTSAVFYSDYTIPRLVSDHEQQEQNAWAGKYTMPTEKFSIFDASTMNVTMSYIIVHKKNQSDFTNNQLSQNFHLVDTTSNFSLYQRTSSEK